MDHSNNNNNANDNIKYASILYRIYIILWFALPMTFIEFLSNIFYNIGFNLGESSCLTRKQTNLINRSSSLTNKIVLVTGANTGIGRETVKAAVMNNAALVILACRDVTRAQKAVDDIIHELDDEAKRKTMSIVELNLSDLKSVRNAAAKVFFPVRLISLIFCKSFIQYRSIIKSIIWMY